MDHVFDIEGWWAKVHPAEHWGAHIEFREYSFFDNHRWGELGRGIATIHEITRMSVNDHLKDSPHHFRLTKEVNSSRLVVTPCEGASCTGGGKVTDVKVGDPRILWIEIWI